MIYTRCNLGGYTKKKIEVIYHQTLFDENSHREIENNSCFYFFHVQSWGIRIRINEDKKTYNAINLVDKFLIRTNYRALNLP